MSEKVENYDVVIIGASIAGNYLSYLLSGTNLKVAVIEEHMEVGRPLQCAGIISMKLTDLVSFPEDIILNRVNTAKILAPSGKYIKLAGEEKPYIIDRVRFDRYFYEQARSSENISFFLGEKYKSFEYSSEKSENCVLIQTSKRKLQSKLLIGCDGPLSSLANQLGVQNDLIYASQIRTKASFPPDEAMMYFDPLWKELFGWVVPEGKNGICRIGLGSSIYIKRKFHNFLLRLNITLADKIEQQGGIIPYGLMNKIAYDHVLLLGDAAGQVKATTGGGIVMLLTAAKYAASCIKKAFASMCFSQSFIETHYEQQCASTIGRQIKIHFIIRTIFAHFSEEDFDLFFQIVKTSKVEEIISLYGDMDFPLALFIRLLKNPLIFKFLLGFLRKNPLLLFKIFKILFK